MKRFAIAALLAAVVILSRADGEGPAAQERRAQERRGSLTSLGMTPWAWERREDLRFLGEGKSVAYYAGLITLDGDRIDIAPRRNPLLLPKNTHRIAVIRIETKSAPRQAPVDAIKKLFRNAEELQIDFDATKSEREFYRALLFDVRREIKARLTITALASWCMDDRWMRGLPIDDAVPMLFRMGDDAKVIRARLARGEDFAEPLCRASIGVSLDEPVIAPRSRRVWVFNDDRWTEEAWQSAAQFASR